MEKKPLKTELCFQPIFEKFKNHHSTEGYALKYVFEIYLPFWLCKQEIVVEKELKIDRFSSILLQLLINDISSHQEICAFLGVAEDSFINMQFHFLIKNNFVRELENEHYEITYEGRQFLENKTQAKQTETMEFEYYSTEKVDFLQNDLTQTFFDPKIPIDKELSTGKKGDFSGYNIVQMDKINPKDNSRTIAHNNKSRPTFYGASQQRNDFAVFFNQQFKEKNFYDFAVVHNFEAHKRNIIFLGLLYEKGQNSKEQAQKEQILEIRQFADSVQKFDNTFQLETLLTAKVAKYLKDNPNWL